MAVNKICAQKVYNHETTTPKSDIILANLKHLVESLKLAHLSYWIALFMGSKDVALKSSLPVVVSPSERRGKFMDGKFTMVL